MRPGLQGHGQVARCRGVCPEVLCRLGPEEGGLGRRQGVLRGRPCRGPGRAGVEHSHHLRGGR
eukprot:8746996-Alexandrium_andersonii.AAC.1